MCGLVMVMSSIHVNYGYVRVEMEVKEVRIKKIKSPRGENLMALLTRLRMTYGTMERVCGYAKDDVSG